MAVTFDAVGPSSSGATAATSPLTWAHTCGASATELLVGISVDSAADAGLTAAVTYNSTPMTSVLRWQAGGSANNAGFAQLFRLASPATGSAFTVSVSVTGTGTFDHIEGGSLSFTGSATLSAAVHADSASATVTSGTLAVPTASASNIAAVIVTNGSDNLAFTAGTSRYVENANPGGNGAAVCVGGATIPGTGGSVSVTWTQNSDWYAAIGVEVQVFTGSSATAVLAPGTGAALNAGVVTSNISVGPRYAGTATDLGGGQGSWATPQYATGGP